MLSPAVHRFALGLDVTILHYCERFETTWEYTLTSALSLGRVQVEVVSGDVVCANITSALIDLAQLVRRNWSADYYAPQVRLDVYVLFRFL